MRLVACVLCLLCGTDAVQAQAAAEPATGMASYYSDRFHGRRTATHERYDKNALTAASNRFPLGARVRVTNLKTRKSVVVRINDRMVDKNPRLIDVSGRAAKALGFHRSGVARVRVEALEDAEDPGQKPPAAARPEPE